ncbi:MAG: glycogen debranching protein GlgX [Thermodesulfovibrionales bacterium]
MNFAVFSENAVGVEVCLFDEAGAETARARMADHTDQVWHVYVPGLGPGQHYGYRVYGPYEPEAGHRFNPSKLLLDPYAKAFSGSVRWHDALLGYRPGMADRAGSRDERDSAPYVPKCVVVDPSYDWEGDSPPRTPWHRTVIYELHVKGFTALHPQVPEDQRGSYAGLTHPASMERFRSLGVTAVELMPVHQSVTERHLAETGLTNYWGYNSIGFFAPDARLCRAGGAGRQVKAFKDMVKAFHREGIEVILDVVYNHTAEGSHTGPTLSFRGIDNRSYYRLEPDSLHHYIDYTGTGNTLNMVHQRVLQLIMDSLRYWVIEMHVDGFRFDLASALARELHDVERLGSFFDVIHQDPVVSQVKLIAEPWDLGPGGYQVGNFPVLWAEWNGKYRDTVRRFWRGDEGQAPDLAYRLTGSSDLYEHGGRRPYASVNYVTCHDGFTLHDLVSYSRKHNEANGEGNRDGSDDDLSWNFGVEGPSDDPEINRLRERQKRSLLATLFLSQGVPMLLAGDEMGRTQLGNNNAYCQDNEVSWLAWRLTEEKERLLDFVRRLAALRREHPVLRRRHFFQGRRISGSGVKDLTWLRPEGGEMTEADWTRKDCRCLGLRLAGDAIEEMDEMGNPIVDDTFLMLLNAHEGPVSFALPPRGPGRGWELLVDTCDEGGKAGGVPLDGDGHFELGGRGLALLRLLKT